MCPYEFPGKPASELDLDGDWPRRWVITWKTTEGDIVSLVRDLAAMPTLLSVPVRRFSWRSRQRHRPGLEFLVSTGRLHGFESLEERSLLLALDFVGTVVEVLAQPFRLRFETTGEGFREHTPDFLAVFRDGSRWLFDVRPGRLVKERDEVCFAAAGEAALAAGWRYSVVTGWRPHVLGVLDALSAQRRALEDQLGLQDRLLRIAGTGQVPFGDLVAATVLPVVARAHALHLL